jgi:hypothetical protein
MRLKKVVLLPLMGSQLSKAPRHGKNVIINIESFVNEHRPPNRIVPAMV